MDTIESYLDVLQEHWSVVTLLYVLIGFGLRGGYALWGQTGRLVYWVILPAHGLFFLLLNWLKRGGRYAWIPLIEPANTLARLWKLLWNPGTWILAGFAWFFWRGCQ